MGKPHTRAGFSRSLVASPIGNDTSQEAALRDLAGADGTPNPAELLNPDDGAAKQLTELSVLDQRFSPVANRNNAASPHRVLGDGKQRI